MSFLVTSFDIWSQNINQTGHSTFARFVYQNRCSFWMRQILSRVRLDSAGWAIISWIFHARLRDRDEKERPSPYPVSPSHLMMLSWECTSLFDHFGGKHALLLISVSFSLSHSLWAKFVYNKAAAASRGYRIGNQRRSSRGWYWAVEHYYYSRGLGRNMFIAM